MRDRPRGMYDYFQKIYAILLDDTLSESFGVMVREEAKTRGNSTRYFRFTGGKY